MIKKTLRGRYNVEAELGEGSTAVVYRATDTRLQRQVALKVLLPHVRENVRQRFFQEATAVARLNHPGIMAIYDLDEADGQHFLVVEYVEGRTLDHFVPSPTDVVVDIGAQIADALAYAHAQGIIHRDIKPANIMVTADGRTKIMDLGLALPPGAKRVTSVGMIIGTPAYLSPEQAQGLPLDTRTDIYSLGIVLYELTAGVLPFDNDDLGVLMLEHVRKQPPAIRQRSPQTPVELEAVILKALQKNQRIVMPMLLNLPQSCDR